MAQTDLCTEPTAPVERPPLFGPTVHVPCGGLRGYIEYVWSRCGCDVNLGRYQSCFCEPAEKWPGVDVSSVIDLCIVCARGTAGGTSRWAMVGCGHCVQAALRFAPDPAFGLLLPLGRHSARNNRFARLSDDEQTRVLAAASLIGGARLQQQMRGWSSREVRRLGAGRVENIPLVRWQMHFPPSLAASTDAISRLHQAVLDSPPAAGTGCT